MHSFACRCPQAQHPPSSSFAPGGGHSNASKSFNFSQHLRTMRCCCWRALSPWAKTKTRAAKNICIKRRETDKSIWIDKCHQNRSGIKFIMPSGGLARWGQSPAELWQPPGGWNSLPSPWERQEHSVIDQLERKRVPQEGSRTFKYWIICFSSFAPFWLPSFLLHNKLGIMMGRMMSGILTATQHSVS